MCKNSLIRKIVAISQRVDVYADRGEVRDALDSRLPRWVDAAGFAPFPVPNDLSQESLKICLKNLSPQGLILSGGNDIGDRPERDRTEKILLDYASEHTLPVLGICRGMQMMCVYSGGTLKPVSGHVRVHHILDSNFRGKKVNSYHDCAIDRLPADYTVTARSEDGEIESVRHNSLPWQGWMWHPERDEDYLSGKDLEYFQKLFNNET